MKACTLCNQEKELDQFLKDKHASGGYRNQCKECLRQRNKEQRVWENRKESYNASMRKYRSTAKGAIHTSYQASKSRAKRDGIPFDIDLEYVTELFYQQNGKCALTGEDMIPKSGRTSPSLDKMTPELGYVRGNIQWTTWKANCMKQDLNMDELIQFCKTVIELRC